MFAMFPVLSTLMSAAAASPIAAWPAASASPTTSSVTLADNVIGLSLAPLQHQAAEARLA